MSFIKTNQFVTIILQIGHAVGGTYYIKFVKMVLADPRLALRLTG